MVEEQNVVQQQNEISRSNKCSSLGTNFHPKKLKNIYKDLIELEYFLAEFVRKLLKRAFLQKRRNGIVYEKYDEISTCINNLIKELKNSGIIMVPTNKTNGYITIIPKNISQKYKNIQQRLLT